MGTLTLVQERDGKKYKYPKDICRANVTCAFISHYKDEKGEKWNILDSFLYDKKHIDNLIKDKVHLFDGEITKIKLNMWYKESAEVLRYFTRMGYKVECYYKEVKRK